MKFEEQLKKDFEKIAKNEPVDDLNEGGTLGKGCTVEWTLDAPSEAVIFDKDCIRCVEQSSKDLLGEMYELEAQALISGAGHDSVSPLTLQYVILHCTVKRQRLRASSGSHKQKSTHIDGFRAL